MTSAVGRLLATARTRISVVDAVTTYRWVGDGALLVDTRPGWQRQQFGVIAGAIVIERNHLEWRLDRTGNHQHPVADAHRGPIVVLCQEGYSSSIAVASLVDMGVSDVHELEGGFDAWVAAGLPFIPGG